MTRRGLGILLLAIGTYVAGRLLGTHELYVLALTFAGFVVLSQVLVTITGAGLSVRREIVAPCLAIL